MALTRTRDIFAINPDGLLTAAASPNRQVCRRLLQDPWHGMSFLPGVLSTSGNIHRELLRLLYYMAHPQAFAYREAPGHRPPRHAPPLLHRPAALDVLHFSHDPGTSLSSDQAIA